MIIFMNNQTKKLLIQNFGEKGTDHWIEIFTNEYYSNKLEVLMTNYTVMQLQKAIEVSEMKLDEIQKLFDKTFPQIKLINVNFIGFSRSDYLHANFDSKCTLGDIQFLIYYKKNKIKLSINTMPSLHQ